jgi:hypothetical protein
MQGCGNRDLCPFEEFKVNTPWSSNVEIITLKEQTTCFHLQLFGRTFLIDVVCAYRRR